MARFGISTPAADSHVNSMVEVALELRRRGHEVVFIALRDVAIKTESFGFESLVVGERHFPQGHTSMFLRRLGELEGFAALGFTLDYICQNAEVILKEAPDLMRTAGIELMIIDQSSFAMPTVADLLQIPYVTVCVALIASLDPYVPPIFSHRIPSDTLFSKMRNVVDNYLQQFFTRRLVRIVQQKRGEWNLPLLETTLRADSTLSTIIQLPKSIDFPRQHTPAYYHYIGRISDPSGEEPLCRDIEFPFEKLDGRRIIYCSLGTIQNQVMDTYKKVMHACSGMNAQLVVSLGNRDGDVAELGAQGGAIVVSFAPQENLVCKAALVITHGGCNTVTMALSYGVPMVVIPIANDQPGMGARVMRAEVGLVIHPRALTADVLRALISEVLGNVKYRERCAEVQKEIEEAGGVTRAADIIEDVAQRKHTLLCTH